MEQLAGRPVYSSDLYSLGLTAIYLLTLKSLRTQNRSATGVLLWQHLVPNLSPEFAATLSQAIHPQPNERFLSAAAMMNHLVLPATHVVDVAQDTAKPGSRNSRESRHHSSGCRSTDIVAHTSNSPRFPPPKRRFQPP
ncbi:hypothetical protein [Acaryochloris sp. CCMEE 5410]|uniref:hypothetical protein n=1 Tax=Acaryochloris sp. CCMEE 5410 TaxID=310037 RepID=UPI0021CFAD74|nr:hypothetical protein [Acaryochloris sp. CCMEE 5410]